MGGNKRYPHHAEQLAEERELREARGHGQLHSLTDEQLALSRNALTIAPERVDLWARAWLRFGDVDVRCTVRVRRWTDDAVGVEAAIDGERLRCWVWRGACTPLASREDGW